MPAGVVTWSWWNVAGCRWSEPRSVHEDGVGPVVVVAPRRIPLHVVQDRPHLPDPVDERSRAFQTMPTRPPGRSTRASSAKAVPASNQWKAWATQTASTDDSCSGKVSALPATRGTLASDRRRTARIPSTGSTATTNAPVGTSRRVSFPVPAARSTTVAPGRIPRFSTSQSTAEGGYDGRELS